MNKKRTQRLSIDRPQMKRYLIVYQASVSQEIENDVITNEDMYERMNVVERGEEAEVEVS